MLTKRRAMLLAVAAVAVLCGCVRVPDVQADARLRTQAQTAFDAGNYARAKALIAQADRHEVPRAELWRRTLDLRIALAEGTQQGELRRLLLAWAEQRDDWTAEDRADAELTLAETLRPEYALDWLYDLDPAPWPPALRARHNLLFTRFQAGKTAFLDETVTRWRLGVRGLYDAGDVTAAAREAERCARQTGNAEAALIAAKLRNELGDEAGKTEALSLALSLSDDDTTRQEAALIRTAPAGTKSAF